MRRYRSRLTRFRRRRTNRRPRRRFTRSKRRGRLVVQTSSQPIARRTLAQLKYAELLTHTLTTGVVLNQQFRLNSIHDPNLSGTGHQPYAHDTYATLYNQYRVYKYSYAIKFPVATSPYIVSVTPQNHANAPTTIDEITERPRTITRHVSPGQAGPTIHGHIYLPRVLGNTSAQYKANEFTSAIFGGNPSEAMTLNVAYFQNTGSNLSLPSVVYTMTYHAELYDPIDLAQS